MAGFPVKKNLDIHRAQTAQLHRVRGRFEEDGQNYLRTTEEAKPFLDAFKDMCLELFNRGPEFKL